LFKKVTIPQYVDRANVTYY